MAEKDIIQNMISRLGQSQDDRLPPELDPEHPHFAKVDERSSTDLLAQARALACHLNYYQHSPDTPAGNWSVFFPPDNDTGNLEKLLNHQEGEVQPHLGLLAAFIKLYQYPQQVLNTITAKHLDFQFRKVLRFDPKPARPDQAHLLLELKKGVAPLTITPDHRFTAGKDGSGVELIYQPVRETVIGHGKVDALHSIFHNAKGVFFAPIANSQDGLGSALDTALPKWRAFGSDKLPPAHIGFALASPVLRMEGGKRTVTIELLLKNPGSGMKDQAGSVFEAHITGAKGWLGPLIPSATLAGNKLKLTFTVEENMPAVTDYHAAVHDHAFATSVPVVQILLKPGATLRYADLSGFGLNTASIHVEVDGLQAVMLENDYGNLNPKKTFLPFGAQPEVGSRFMIGCEEALSKNLKDIKIKLTWQGAPSNLGDWYKGYTEVNTIKNGIRAKLSYFTHNGQPHTIPINDIMQGHSSGTTTIGTSTSFRRVVPQQNASNFRLLALLSGGSAVSRRLGKRMAMEHPVYGRQSVPTPQARSGYLTITLLEDFLHADYRKESIANALNRATIRIPPPPKVLNEPYTPKVQAFSLSYSTNTEVEDISDSTQDSFVNPSLQFFHVGCFGQRREHAYLRQQYQFVPDKPISLFPDYASEGEFLIGVSGVAAGDSVSLLMQVAEGSADPQLESQKLDWSVLCDNFWRTLTPQELVLDCSNNLRTSGIITVTLPPETSTEHTWMPTGRVWLRATVQQDSAAVCQLVSVTANAVEVRFVDQGNNPSHLTKSLAAGSIAKLKTPLAEVKKVSQPYPGFGGSPKETDRMLIRRAAERLRHRNRCITPWDYERMILEAFPNIYKVKCIPHASETSWLAPGHVLLVVIPDLHTQRASDRFQLRTDIDRLQPRADNDTLSRIEQFARRHCGTQVEVIARNPNYQSVRLEFKVRFQSDYPFNYYSQQLHEAIIRTLSPWTFDVTHGRNIEFGGRIYRSVLLDFVEELPYVDFVTDFRMGLAGELGTLVKDVPEISADRPDAILVSDATHTISEVTVT